MLENNWKDSDGDMFEPETLFDSDLEVDKVMGDSEKLKEISII